MKVFSRRTTTMDYSKETSSGTCLLSDYTAERVVYPGFFSEGDLVIFSKLILNRRALPIYLGDCWRCYDCIFESNDFEAMANHIMKAHKPAPVDEDTEID
jgi:hypothetical protein